MLLPILRIALAALLMQTSDYGAGEPIAPPEQILSPEALLGREIFHDESLSASGRMSCATCHDPAHAFARGPGQGPVALGGPNLDIAGFRKVPSLRYLAKTPAFFFDKRDGKATPTGGLARDGRANTLAEQARLPLLSPQEMANASPEDVAAKLSRARYAAQFRSVYGQNIFAEPRLAFEKALRALQQFQLEDTAHFAPFTSKYDYFLAGMTPLSLQERRGLALFENPKKANCAACHPAAKGKDGTPPLFTDFTYDNIGVPRNAAIPANRDKRYFDLGLCGPFREDLSRHKELCGAFKVPTLRNIAVTPPYFHNGSFDTLREVVEFYVSRDSNWTKWYSRAAGHPRKFDDLPQRYVRNVNRTEPPYDKRNTPALSSTEIDDIVAFLRTLTDGYQH